MLLVAIVEDSIVEADALKALLVKHNLEVLIFSNSLDALNYLRENRVDVTLIDYSLPGLLNGLSLARQLRQLYPADVIIMMSAYAGVDELVEAIQIGADDFIIKPLQPNQVIHRISDAVMRRREWFPQYQANHVNHDNLEIDPRTHKARYCGAELDLTPTQFSLLTQLAAKPRYVYSYSALYSLTKGQRLSPEEARSKLKAHIINLRHILEADGRPQAIHNVRGMGYKWDPDAQDMDDDNE